MLKPKCTEALRRIFKVSDVDKDGLLNASELNQFQVRILHLTIDHRPLTRLFLRLQQKCFSTPLQQQELEGILDLVRSYDPTLVQPILSTAPSSSTTTPAEGITELGFLYLHTIFVQQGRMETTWTVLRKFGYGEGLELGDDVLSPRCVLDRPGMTMCNWISDRGIE
jgi:mitochondrial Rho GTPase 1